MNQHEVDVLTCVALGNLFQVVDEERVARDINAVAGMEVLELQLLWSHWWASYSVDYSVGGLLGGLLGQWSTRWSTRSASLTRFCAEEPHEYSYKYRTSSQTVDYHQVIQLILNQFYSAVQLHFQQEGCVVAGVSVA
jgi:hypothetical protein